MTKALGPFIEIPKKKINLESILNSIEEKIVDSKPNSLINQRYLRASVTRSADKLVPGKK